MKSILLMIVMQEQLFVRHPRPLPHSLLTYVHYDVSFWSGRYNSWWVAAIFCLWLNTTGKKQLPLRWRSLSPSCHDHFCLTQNNYILWDINPRDFPTPIIKFYDKSMYIVCSKCSKFGLQFWINRSSEVKVKMLHWMVGNFKYNKKHTSDGWMFLCFRLIRGHPDYSTLCVSNSDILLENTTPITE